MNIIEAINSGQPFKREGHLCWRIVMNGKLMNCHTDLEIDYIPVCDIIANDYKLLNDEKKGI